MKMAGIGMVLVVFVLLCFQPGQGGRVLQTEDQELLKRTHNSIRPQALPKGDGPPSGPSGCTYIPGSGGSGCPINEMHFAGGALPRASAYPRLMDHFGLATKQK